MKIELSGLAKKYASENALADISLRIEPGQLVALIGLNGAGKTTLLRLLSGVVSPTRGKVLYDGETFNRARIDLRKRLLFLPDFPALYPHLTPLQHVAMMARLYDREPADLGDALVRVFEELDLLPLAEVPVVTLSRGQLYKVALATLVLINPELWLLDEPFASGLDPQGLAMFKEYARAAIATGTTVIYTTQILEIAERFADQICVIDRGALRQIYSKAELLAMPANGPDSLEFRLRQFREVQS